MKPVEQLIAELRAVSRRGVRYVWFSDDNFRLEEAISNPSVNGLLMRIFPFSG